MARKKVVKGRILMVQEDRFRLVGETGKGYLLSLAHDAPVSGSDLSRMQDADITVLVHYEGEPNLDSGIAHVVEPLH
jgi:hypothetical protein